MFSRVKDTMSTATHEERLADFAKRQARPLAHPAKRSGAYRIPERCRLPSLEQLLQIDAAAERAASQPVYVRTER